MPNASDRGSANTELAAVLEYYGKVKGRCIPKPDMCKQRKARREADNAGLKEYISIPEREAASFVQRPRRGNVRGVIAPEAFPTHLIQARCMKNERPCLYLQRCKAHHTLCFII